jgi:hypothetical protein
MSNRLDPRHGGRGRQPCHPRAERLEERRLLSARLIGITGNQTNPNPNTTDEVLYDIDYTSNPGAIGVTRLVELPFVPDSDAIGYNPENGLLYRVSGSESYRDNPDQIAYHDNHFMQTVDLRPGANLAQAGVFNANPEGERRFVDDVLTPTGPYGLPAPFPTFVVPNSRRTDAQTDSSFGTGPAGQGPNEYSALRDLTWSGSEHLFYGADTTGIYRITPTGTVTFVSNPAAIDEPKGITFFNAYGRRSLVVGDRDSGNLHLVDPTTGETIGNPIPLLDATTFNVPTGILSLVEHPDGKTLLAINKSSGPFARELIKIELTRVQGDPIGLVTVLGQLPLHFADLAFVPGQPPEVFGRRVFYNNSALDNNTAGASPADDNAVDESKSPVVGTPDATSITSYSRGLNGVFVDVFALPTATTTLTAADFTIRSTSQAAPNAWAAGPAPTSVTIRKGQGPGGTDRVTLIWSDATAVRNGYLEVTVKNNAATGLASAQRFVFGNLVGDANGDKVVDVSDLGILATNYNQSGQSPATGDFDASGTVDVADLGALATNYNKTLGNPPAALRASAAPARPAVFRSLSISNRAPAAPPRLAKELLE